MVVYRRNLSIDLYLAGGHKELSSILADPIKRRRLWAHMWGGGGIAGSQPMSTAVQMEPK